MGTEHSKGFLQTYTEQLYKIQSQHRIEFSEKISMNNNLLILKKYLIVEYITLKEIY